MGGNSEKDQRKEHSRKREYHKDENRKMQVTLNKYFNWSISPELQRNERYKGHKNSETRL